MYLDVKINNVPVQLEVKTVGPASLTDIDEFREKLKAGHLVLVDQSTFTDKTEGIDDVRPNSYIGELNTEDSHPSEGKDKDSINRLEPISTAENSSEILVESDTQSIQQSHSVENVQSHSVAESSADDLSGDTPSESSGSSVSGKNGGQSDENSDSEIEKPSLIDVAEDIIEDIPDLIEDVKDIFEQNKDSEVTNNIKPWYKSKTIISNILAAVGCVLGVLVSENPEASMYLPASIVAFINLYLRSVSKDEIKFPIIDKVKNFRKK